jgi:hypothetical protein
MQEARGLKCAQITNKAPYKTTARKTRPARAHSQIASRASCDRDQLYLYPKCDQPIGSDEPDNEALPKVAAMLIGVGLLVKLIPYYRPKSLLPL